MGKERDSQAHEESSPKRGYSHISLQVRKKLIHKVLEENIKVKSAAKQLKIKLSTAKAIIYKFKNTQEIYETKKAKIKREILEKRKNIKQKLRTSPNKCRDSSLALLVVPNVLSIEYTRNMVLKNIS